MCVQVARHYQYMQCNALLRLHASYKQSASHCLCLTTTVRIQEDKGEEGAIKLPNPVILSSVQLWEAVQLRGIVASAMQARVGIAGVDMSEIVNPEISIPTSSAQSAAFKALKEYLKGVKDLPTWFCQWRDKRTEDNHKKAAAAAAAAEAKEAEGDNKDVKPLGEEEQVAPGQADPAEANDNALKFKVGDIVMGCATKYKEKYAQPCKITGILARHFNVIILEGPCAGDKHKFLHHAVKAIDHGPPQGDGAGASSATPGHEVQEAERGDEGGDDVAMEDIAGLFGQ